MISLSRRYLTFSLRTFFVALTIGCLCLGWKAERARDQREAAEAIQALGGVVFYDWGLDKLPSGIWDIHEGEPGGPAWLRRIVGDDFFQQARGVYFHDSLPETEAKILKSLAHLRRLGGLKLIFLPCAVSKTTHGESVAIAVSDGTIEKLKDALPDCEVMGFAPNSGGSGYP